MYLEDYGLTYKASKVRGNYYSLQEIIDDHQKTLSIKVYIYFQNKNIAVGELYIWQDVWYFDLDVPASYPYLKDLSRLDNHLGNPILITEVDRRYLIKG